MSTNGPLTQHVHLTSQTRAGTWVAAPSVYRTVLGLRFALTRARSAGRAVSWRFCADPACTGGGWPHGARERRPVIPMEAAP